MAGLGFRPRPIDVNKQMPIFRGDPPEHEAAGYTAVRGVPEMPTGMESDEEEEAHIQGAILAGTKREKRHEEENANGLRTHTPPEPGVEIPTPGCLIVRTYEAETPIWKRPDNYVLYTLPTNDELDEIVEYDADSDDDMLAKRLGMSIEAMELLLDRIEKLAGYADGETPPIEQVSAALGADPAYAKSGVPSAEVLAQAHDYWVAKRRGNCGAPFLERFRKPPAPDDPSPFRAFRAREKERAHKKKALANNDQAAYERMLLLRQDLDRLRALLDLVRKRELLKRTHVQAVRSASDGRIAEVARKAARRRSGVWQSEDEDEEDDVDNDDEEGNDDDDDDESAVALEKRVTSASAYEEDEDGEASWAAPTAADTRHDGEWNADDNRDEGDDDMHYSHTHTHTRAARQARSHTRERVDRERPRTTLVVGDDDEDKEEAWSDSLLPKGAVPQAVLERAMRALPELASLRTPDGQAVRGRVRWGRGGRVIYERQVLAPAPHSAVVPVSRCALNIANAYEPEDDPIYSPPPFASPPPALPVRALGAIDSSSSLFNTASLLLPSSNPLTHTASASTLLSPNPFPTPLLSSSTNAPSSSSLSPSPSLLRQESQQSVPQPPPSLRVPYKRAPPLAGLPPVLLHSHPSVATHPAPPAAASVTVPDT